MLASISLAFPAMAAAVESISCHDYCTDKFGSQSSGYIMGTAPFCSGDCYDCHDGDYCGPLNGDFSDAENSCWSGSKQCCCTRTPERTAELAQKRASEAEALQASAPSCDDYCSRHGIKYGYVRGTAPFCGASPDDCCENDWPGMQASEFEDGGSGCMTGSKQCCCGTNAGQSGCPKPGPGDLSCFVISKVCDLIANQNITTSMGCHGLAAEGVGLCQTVGLGPEDPWADICSAVIAGVIEVGCNKAVDAARQYGAEECKRAAGCDPSGMRFTNTTNAFLV